MFMRLLDIEWRKLLKHPLAWLELTALAGIVGMYFVARYALVASSAARGVAVEPRSLELDLRDGLELFGFVSVAFYAAAASLVTSYDFPKRGVQAWLLRGVPRPLLIVARLFIVLLLGLLLVAAASVAILCAASLASLVFLGQASPTALDWSRLMPTVLAVFGAAIPYLALTAFLAVASRSPLFAASGTVVFRTVLENLLLHLSDRFPALVRLLPAQLAVALELHTYALSRTAEAAAPSTLLLPEPQAAIAVGGLLVLFTCAAAVVFSRQDWGG